MIPSDLLPPYPVYTRQRFNGDLPSAGSMGPPDVRPSSLNPAYSLYAGTFGRHLAGLGGIMRLSADEGIKDYANELDVLQIADDVNGNGMFDPEGSHGNIHPDYGIFAEHQSLPGYVARDKFYRPSEVVDATTGRQVMYVPGGAVYVDPAQKEAYAETLLWEIPPAVSPARPQMIDDQSTWIPREAEWPIGATEESDQSPGNGKVFAIALFAGLSVGLVAGLVSKGK